ncbi:MAG: CoA transferase [Actinomycetota bacterium]|nr:CoA transferase [Actinomycetota bacterium]
MGPLHGITVIELAAIGPVPMCGMLLGDLGAAVIRIDRPGGSTDPLRSPMGRNRRSVAVDLKRPDGAAVVLRLVAAADVLIEGMRPGVAERLGVGPEQCHGVNPGLVYGRMTGWGQEGPLAVTAGHDIDYIAVAGALHAMGDAASPPQPPLNLVGDFGGGALYLACGVLAALLERTRSGTGQVVDAAMIDGVSSMLTMFHELAAMGLWTERRGDNLLDGGAPFYTTYRTADGRFVAVGALEPQFFAALLDGLGLEGDAPVQLDRSGWPEMRRRFAARFAQSTLAQWTETFAGTDACVAPVLTMSEVAQHPHTVARGGFIDVGGVLQTAPAPRFSRSRPDPPTAPVAPGSDTDAVLSASGFTATEIAALRAAGTVA